MGADQRLNMKSLFEFAANANASDLLVTAGAPPIVRVDGELHPILEIDLGPEHTRRLIWSLLNETQQEAFERKRELDFSLAVTGDMRFRANVYYQKGAVAGAFRLIPRTVPAMEELGIPDLVREWTLRSHGLILVTGPTGCGKTTSMASMIDLINDTRRCHIVTVEDPIEFIHPNKHAVVDQREVFADTLSFSNALKYVLRQDPDVILVGEMRDPETISATLTAAETGHLVIATLHTNDAVQSIDRIVDVFPPHHHDQIRVQLAFALVGVCAQQLIPRKDGQGRVLATELLPKTAAVANHIREGKTHQTRSIMEASGKEGMLTMDQRLKELYETGLIAYEEVARRISNPMNLRQFRAPEDEPAEDVPVAEEPSADRPNPAAISTDTMSARRQPSGVFRRFKPSS
jgi:twitching motility protein PilT